MSHFRRRRPPRYSINTSRWKGGHFSMLRSNEHNVELDIKSPHTVSSTRFCLSHAAPFEPPAPPAHIHTQMLTSNCPRAPAGYFLAPLWSNNSVTRKHYEWQTPEWSCMGFFPVVNFVSAWWIEHTFGVCFGFFLRSIDWWWTESCGVFQPGPGLHLVYSNIWKYILIFLLWFLFLDFLIFL